MRTHKASINHFRMKNKEPLVYCSRWDEKQHDNESTAKPVRNLCTRQKALSTSETCLKM